MLLKSETWGETKHGSVVNPQSTQHLDLFASFESIYIHVSESEPAVAALSQGPSKPIQEDITLTYSAAPGLELRIDAMIGDVRVEGVDSQRIELTATTIVRVSDVDKVRMALEGLALRVEVSPARRDLATWARPAMVVPGCSSSRDQLCVRCPKPPRVRGVPEAGAP